MSRGIQGIGSNVRSATSRGDWALVNVQSSSWNTAQCVRCVINLAVAPAPWLDWMRESLGSLPKSVRESLGLYRDRLHSADTPAGVDGWWQISSQSAARTAAADMVVQLAEHGWPTLTRLLGRQALIGSIRSGNLGHTKGEHEVFFARAEAVLIAEDGSSARLDELLERDSALAARGMVVSIGSSWTNIWAWPNRERRRTTVNCNPELQPQGVVRACIFWLCDSPFPTRR
jgi:hypothetical protein